MYRCRAFFPRLGRERVRNEPSLQQKIIADRRARPFAQRPFPRISVHREYPGDDGNQQGKIVGRAAVAAGAARPGERGQQRKRQNGRPCQGRARPIQSRQECGARRTRPQPARRSIKAEHHQRHEPRLRGELVREDQRLREQRVHTRDQQRQSSVPQHHTRHAVHADDGQHAQRHLGEQHRREAAEVVESHLDQVVAGCAVMTHIVELCPPAVRQRKLADLRHPLIGAVGLEPNVGVTEIV